MSKKFLVLSIFLVVVVAPGSAWLLAKSTNKNTGITLPDPHVQPATKAELTEAVKTEKKLSHFSSSSENLPKIESVASFKKYDIWWYIVNVKVTGRSTPLPMIVAKFYDGNEGYRIYTNPGESLVFKNISDTLGIPYDVIDDYNATLARVWE